MLKPLDDKQKKEKALKLVQEEKKMRDKLSIEREISAKKHEVVRLEASARSEAMRKVSEERDLARFQFDKARLEKEIQTLENEVRKNKSQQELEKQKHRSSERNLYTESVRVENTVQTVEREYNTKNREYLEKGTKMTLLERDLLMRKNKILQLEHELIKEKKDVESMEQDLLTTTQTREHLKEQIVDIENKLREDNHKKYDLRLKVTTSDRNQLYSSTNNLRVRNDEYLLSQKVRTLQMLEMNIKSKQGHVKLSEDSMKKYEDQKRKVEEDIKGLQRGLF